MFELALDDAFHILNLKLDPVKEPKLFTALMTRKTTIISSVMSAMVRVNEVKMRGLRQSQVERVLKLIKQAEEKMRAN